MPESFFCVQKKRQKTGWKTYSLSNFAQRFQFKKHKVKTPTFQLKHMDFLLNFLLNSNALFI